MRVNRCNILTSKDTLISPAKDKEQKNTIAVLDGVRALACLGVLAFHLHLISLEQHVLSFSVIGTLASSILMMGSSGVTLFFILSGFLLFLPYAKALLFDSQWSQWPGMRRFYLRRALRIFPGYYTALFLIILLQHREYLQPQHLKELGLFLTFFMDSTQATYQQINGPFWTLAVEFQFYLLLPLLALGLRFAVRRVPEQRRLVTLLLCLLGMIVWGVLTRYWGWYLTLHPTETLLVPRPVQDVLLFFLYGRSGKYLEDFAIGMIISACYAARRQVSLDHPLSSRLRRLSGWLWGAGLVWLLLVSVWHFNDWFHLGWQFLSPIAQAFEWLGEISLSVGFGLCITALLFGPAYLRRPVEWGPLRWIGLISYSIYIWHLPILRGFGDHITPLYNLPPLIPYSALWLCALLVIIPFSFAIYKWIEAPWIRLGARLQRG